MSIDWKPFVELVRRHQRFLLTTHYRPDGDGLGSMLALGEGLRQLGKEVQLLIAGSFPTRYQFLDPEQRIQSYAPPGDSWRKAEIAVVMDTGTWNQLSDVGPFLRELTAQRVVIDHHMTQDDLNALRLVDVSAEATGRLSHEAITALGVKLTPSIAQNLFVAIAMDTGWFRHSNTSPATFALASELERAGAKPDALYDLLFERNSLPRLKLMGLVLERLQVVSNSRVAFTEIRRDDYERTGASPQDTEDLVNYARSIVGVEVGLLFMEQPRGGVKISFRSRGAVDVAKLAERFNGGGHKLASGAVIDAPLEEARKRVLDALQAVL